MPRSNGRRWWCTAGRWVVAIGTGAVALGETAAWLATRSAPRSLRGARCAIVVLGFPSTRRGTVSAVQRWRVRIAVRTLAAVDDGWLIFTGGATLGAAESEAEVMARHAIEQLGVAADRVHVEPTARSTWENVHRSLPIAERLGAEQISFASDSIHAWRARLYLRRQRPDLATRIVRADDHRWFEYWWFKPLMLADVARWLPVVVRDGRSARQEA